MPYFPQSDALVLPAPVLTYRNILGRNGGFEVWQRGAGGSATFSFAGAQNQYTADGWFFFNGNATGFCSQAGGITSGSRWSGAYGRSVGQTGVGGLLLEYPLDTDEVALMRGSIVTLSFTLQSGPNWSPTGGVIGAGLYVGTGTPARRSAGVYTGEQVPIATNFAIAPSTTARFTAVSTVVIPGTATQASVVFSWTPAGTAGASDYIIFDDVQLEIGSVATPFERRPFESELLACKRHYQKSFLYGTAPAANLGASHQHLIGQSVGAGQGQYSYGQSFVPSLRNTPTVALFNPAAVNTQARNLNTGTDCSGTSLYTWSENELSFVFATPAGSAAGNAIGLCWTADAGI